MVTHKVTGAWKTTGGIIILHILIFQRVPKCSVAVSGENAAV
jgi:hypothetical protein